tara:strand:+ start:294 stop:491 length:198 start_codon:yes stop_codon:yes gene_type:complete
MTTTKKVIKKKVQPTLKLSNKDIAYLAATFVEAAQSMCTKLGRDIDIVEFPKTYAKMKKLYEELD